MRRLSQADTGDGRQVDALLPAGAGRVVLVRLSDGHTLQRDLGAETPEAARPRLLQYCMVVHHQVTPASCAGPWSHRSACHWRAWSSWTKFRSPAPRTTRRAAAAKNHRRRSHQGKLLVAGVVKVGEGGPAGSAWRRARTSPPTACTLSRAPTSPPAPRSGPTAGPATLARPASHMTPHRRKLGRPCRSAPGSSRICQPQDPGAGRLLRPCAPTPAILPGRVRYPLQPAPIPPRRDRSTPGIGAAINPAACGLLIAPELQG